MFISDFSSSVSNQDDTDDVVNKNTGKGLNDHFVGSFLEYENLFFFHW